MSTEPITHEMKVHHLPIDQITVLNSRSRGKPKFKQIVANIAALGLKKPITVARRPSPDDGGDRYVLCCGQGRLEAFIALGQTEIPAIIVEATDERVLLMSLAENLARRPRTTMELAREIADMKERGYKSTEIAKKVDLHPTYVNGMLNLLQRGERRRSRASQPTANKKPAVDSIRVGIEQEPHEILDELWIGAIRLDPISGSTHGVVLSGQCTVWRLTCQFSICRHEVINSVQLGWFKGDIDDGEQVPFDRAFSTHSATR